MKTVFTNGCFDILHPAHMRLLEFCKTLGKVVVGLNSDKSVSEIKGDGRPFFSQEDREFMLISCKYVDEVHIFHEKTPYNLIKQVKPDIIVKGGDYKKGDVVGNDLAEVVIYDYIQGFSTTSIVQNFNNR